MKYVYAIALFLLFPSCRDNPNNNGSIRGILRPESDEKITSGSYIIAIDGSRYTIAIYDGCQYLISRADNSITHIGSCTNRIHNTYHCDTLIIHDTIFVDKRIKHKY